jgi:hypothetical protein
MRDVRTALAVAFSRPWAAVLSVLTGAAMALLLLWSGEMLKRFPSGWELHFEPSRLIGVVLLSALFGLLLPLEICTLARAGAAWSGSGGAAGVVVGLVSVSCCAPFVVPALLSFAGFSGTALLSFNGAARQVSGPLTALSIALLMVSIALVSRTLTAACRLPAATPR